MLGAPVIAVLQLNTVNAARASVEKGGGLTKL